MAVHKWGIVGWRLELEIEWLDLVAALGPELPGDVSAIDIGVQEPSVSSAFFAVHDRHRAGVQYRFLIKLRVRRLGVGHRLDNADVESLPAGHVRVVQVSNT